nr:hypothetical protein Iba_chr09cCG5350 [Ipomoea batatas]
MLILCCCSVRNSTPSNPPSVAIISGLVVTALAGSRHARNSDSHYGRLVDFEAPGPNHFVPVNSPAVAGSLLRPSLGLGPECRQDFRERQIEIGSPIPLGRAPMSREIRFVRSLGATFFLKLFPPLGIGSPCSPMHCGVSPLGFSTGSSPGLPHLLPLAFLEPVLRSGPSKMTTLRILFPSLISLCSVPINLGPLATVGSPPARLTQRAFLFPSNPTQQPLAAVVFVFVAVGEALVVGSASYLSGTEDLGPRWPNRGEELSSSHFELLDRRSVIRTRFPFFKDREVVVVVQGIFVQFVREKGIVQ